MKLCDLKFDEFYDKYQSNELDSIDFTNEINNIAEELLEEAHNGLSRYGITVSNNYLKSILNKHIDLAYEVITEGISDTCQREKILNVVTYDRISMHYPCYGDTIEYKTEVFTKLEKSCDSNFTFER